MKTLFHKYYDEVMLSDKKQRPFQSAFGTTPEEWFISCQEDLDIFQVDGKIRYPIDPMLGYSLLEKSKGSVFHFLKHFPKAKLLKDWANNLELLQ